MATRTETLTSYYNNTPLSPEQLQEMADFITARNQTMFTMPENRDLRLLIEWEEHKLYVETGRK